MLHIIITTLYILHNLAMLSADCNQGIVSEYTEA
jgi:hypothetical protein